MLLRIKRCHLWGHMCHQWEAVRQAWDQLCHLWENGGIYGTIRFGKTEPQFQRLWIT